jgi:uncharacterized protein YecE (DUF72 family)
MIERRAMHTLPLFPEPEPEHPAPIDRARLTETLKSLASEQIYVGTSSWKYEGWIGQIYTRERYLHRGRFSQREFEQRCLAEYAETFPIVCGDFSFYQFPSAEFWEKLFANAPPPLQFAFKIPEEITIKTYPTHPRYGPRAGEFNPMFLNADLLKAGFLEALLPYRDRIAVLIVEFGTFSRRSYENPLQFLPDLDTFLARLPRTFRWAVEVRNEELLVPEYFHLLQKHGVAHVFSAWTRVPPLSRQLQFIDAHTANFTVVRALLRVGRPYEQAVQQFQPYTHVQDPNPSARQAMRDLISTARKRREPAYLFINNRLEGNAPVTIDAVVHGDASE